MNGGMIHSNTLRGKIQSACTSSLWSFLWVTLFQCCLNLFCFFSCALNNWFLSGRLTYKIFICKKLPTLWQFWIGFNDNDVLCCCCLDGNPQLKDEPSRFHLVLRMNHHNQVLVLSHMLILYHDVCSLLS